MFIALLLLFGLIQACVSVSASEFYVIHDLHNASQYNDMVAIRAPKEVAPVGRIAVYVLSEQPKLALQKLNVKQVNLQELKSGMPVEQYTLDEMLQNMASGRGLSSYKPPNKKILTSAEATAFFESRFKVLMKLVQRQSNGMPFIPLDNPEIETKVRLIGGQIYKRFGFHGLVHVAEMDKLLLRYLERLFDGIGEFRA